MVIFSRIIYTAFRLLCSLYHDTYLMTRVPDTFPEDMVRPSETYTLGG